ncbi:MAG: hypothetical protein ACHQHK_05895, partial [Dongiales bacterium]
MPLALDPRFRGDDGRKRSTQSNAATFSAGGARGNGCEALLLDQHRLAALVEPMSDDQPLDLARAF